MAIEKKKESQTVFKTLNAVNVTPFTEKFNNLSYLTWSKAIEVVLDLYPDMSYEIVFNEETNLPYFVSDEGIMCYTKVTIEGVTRMMWLPVMDHTNRAMKMTPYQYQIFDKWEKKFVTKTVEKCCHLMLTEFCESSIIVGECVSLPEMHERKRIKTGK